MSSLTFYEVLQLDPSTATKSDIRSAYREAVKTAHPDAGGSRKDFDIVQSAYDTLSDPKKKKRYDASLSVVNGNPTVSKRGNPSWDTSPLYQSYDTFTNDYLRSQWASVASSNVDPFGTPRSQSSTQRQTKTATVLQKDIVGGKIERHPDLSAQYGAVNKDWYAPMPTSRTTANIDVVLNRDNDYLRTLLPGDRITMTYNGVDIDMTLMSLSIKAHGNGSILIRLEMER